MFSIRAEVNAPCSHLINESRPRAGKQAKANRTELIKYIFRPLTGNTDAEQSHGWFGAEPKQKELKE